MDHLLASSSSSSTSVLSGTYHYDVFLSFRGEDTRKSFLGHLYGALNQKGIRTFIDNEELKRGEEISPSLINAIRGSKISIIIFSKNYASSSWCLDELVEILDCRESLGQLVWPLFFDVDPSDVRNCKGSFGDALAIYEQTSSNNEEEEKLPIWKATWNYVSHLFGRDLGNEGSFGEASAKYEETSLNKKKEKLPKWKAALNKASNLSGWHLANGDESQLIQTIVEAALSKLNRTPLYVSKYPVGIEDRLKELEPLIDVAKKNVRLFIGLYGMGGIGKTTLAKALYNYFSDEFEGSSFLANVRDTSKQHLSFVQLQETLLFDVLGDKNLKVGNIHRGINIIKERLCNKRVLLILDDVDDLDQLETLAGAPDWFGLGSRIIITTRNKHLLTTHGVDEIYEVLPLDHDRAVELLSRHAFKREKPLEGYLMLSNRIVHYADGLPLALVLLGSFLCGRKEVQWQSTIQNLENKPEKKLYEILKVSYDALQDSEKSLFLDIACFFVGKDTDYVIKVLESRNYCPIIGIEVLTDMSLINVEFHKLRMHHLIEEVGKEIVRKESPEAGERSRLWCPDDVFHVFSENTGTNSIEGIMLKLQEQRTLYLNAKSFEKMKRLRLLIFSNVALSTAIEYLPNELRLIDFPGYQFPSLPFKPGPKQLVILSIPHNHIHQLGKNFKNFERLKILNLSHSKFLRKIPDLSTAPNLESLHVDHCTNLVEIHESIGFLTKLVTLDAHDCSNLNTIPSNLVSKNFTTLDFHGCWRLKIFPNIIEKIEFLTELNLSGTSIKDLPSSIDLIVSLRDLRLYACKKLVHIPSSIYKLQFLDVLDLNGCTNLSKLPEYDAKIHGRVVLSWLNLRNCNISEEDFLTSAFSFPLLKSLDLSENKFVNLSSIHKLSKLEHLALANCQLLQKIPELPGCQINLNARHCKSLVDTPSNIIAKIISNHEGFLRDSEVEVEFPGSDIPNWFSLKSATGSAICDIPRNVLKKVAAVTICVVSRSSMSERMQFTFELLDENGSRVGSKREENIEAEPGNMFFIYLPARSILSECFPYSPLKNDAKMTILQKIEQVRKIKVSFSCSSSKCDCGIHVLWDGSEIMIGGKKIKTADTISQSIYRTFNLFANERYGRSFLHPLNTRTNMYETRVLGRGLYGQYF